MNRGQYIKIYQKPMSHEDYEGVGKIVKVHRQSQDGVEIDVAFRDDIGPYRRIVCEPFEFVPSFPLDSEP